jgi:hypothetical protein
MFTSALGCLGAALSMTLPWPQVWRSVARRRIHGLSATACWLGVALPIGWITYGLLIGDRLQVVTNSVTGGAGAAILAALLIGRLDLRTGRRLLVSAAGAAGVLGASAFSAASAARPDVAGPEAANLLGAVLAVGSILAAIPQPLSLLRDRTQDLSGLSPLRWRLAAGACAAWFAYGLATGQPAVWLSAGVGLAGALLVCAVLVRAEAPAPVVAGTALRPAARGVARVRTTGVARVRPAADLPTLVMPAHWLPSRELVTA